MVSTGDVDLLLTEEGFNDFCARFVGKNYSRVPDRPFRLIDRTSQITVDILATGLFPGSGDPGPIAFPDLEDVKEGQQKRRSPETLARLFKRGRRLYRCAFFTFQMPGTAFGPVPGI